MRKDDDEAQVFWGALGAAFQKMRKARRRQQDEIAKQIDTSTAYLSELERGVKWPSANTLVNLARTLSVPVWILMLLAEEKANAPTIEDNEAPRAKKLADQIDGLVDVVRTHLADLLPILQSHTPIKLSQQPTGTDTLGAGGAGT